MDIDIDKMYTSYFAVAWRRAPLDTLIGIALYSPKGFKGGECKALVPPPSLLKAYKLGDVDSKTYEEVYRRDVLSKLDAFKVYEELKGKVLCCYEKSLDFCHRHIIMDWIRSSIGDHAVGGEVI